MNLGAPRVDEFSFHGIQTIGLKFTIDKDTASMVPLRVLSRTNLAGSSPSISFTSSISFASFRLRTLDLSLRSFSPLDPLFSITSALFSQNTGGGGISTRPRHALLPPSHAPRGASIPCALTRLRILPVAMGAWGERRNSPRSVDGNFRQDSGGLRLARGANAPRLAGASAFARSGCYGLLTFGLLTAGILHSYDCARRRDSSPRPHGPIRHVVSLSVCPRRVL